MEFAGKKVTVIGLGKSGISASRLLAVHGAKVSVSEAKETESLRQAAHALKDEGISVELGGHTKEMIRGRDLIVTSPGVPLTSPPLQWAKEEGISVIGEIELGYLFCKGNIIAVTGSNGKSTTVTLLGAILKEGGKRAFVCGNIGEAFCHVVSQMSREDWAVLEVSSFQLEQCRLFHPHIAVVLNISPNHLDRHPSFEEYRSAKRRIAHSQTANDYLLLNADDPFAVTLGKGYSVQKRYFSRTKKVEGVFLRRRDVFSSLHDKEERVCSLESLQIPGPHNEENALSAILAALLIGVKPEAIQKSLRIFKGLPHRIEWVGECGGVRFFNDSKSTTVSSTLRALETLPEPLLLIAGGREKNEDFHAFAESSLLRKVKRIFLIGEAKEKIGAAVSGKVATMAAKTLEEAVQFAYQNSRPGETILLSPMCTSFDMFHDFEERGDCFKRSVATLLKSEKSIAEKSHAR